METPKGALHPMTLVTNDIVRIFTDLGFTVATGPEMEDEWYNFDALNVSKDHPARDMQDTFWIKASPEEIEKTKSMEHSSRKVLRTQTTAATARFLEQKAKEGNFPCASISVGKTFRNEATDATHEMQFFQVDGCAVGKDITLANLKSTLLALYQGVLGKDVDIQLRPSYFPFVEPGIEVWIKFRNRWLEVAGGGMIHPSVLRNVGIDPEVYQGFAFGGGVDRILMIKHDIPDIRYLHQGDLRINQW